jgi:3-deoxy-7-phosphoheptulonate synthase
MIEVHPDPDHALSDGAQSLTPDQYDELTEQVGPIASAIRRTMTPALGEPTLTVG